MKWCALAVIAVLGCGSPPPAQHPTDIAGRTPAKAKHPEELAMMERYLKSPFREHASSDKIKDFIAKNPDVLVEIDEQITPFLAEDLDDDAKSLLLLGFFAGDAAAQLRDGMRGDDRYAGVEGVLRVYAQIKALSSSRLKDLKVRSPSLEQWLALRQRGELRAHVAVKPGRANQVAARSPAVVNDGEEAQRLKQVTAGLALVQAGHAQEAISAYFDPVLASYQKQYAGDKRHIYCGHSPPETLLYMLKSANANEEAVALSPTWAEAWFSKSFALTELHRGAEAEAALDRALALSPSYAHYLSERGYLLQKKQDWARSLELFTAAEDAAKLVTDPQVQLKEQTRALRGQAYAHVELGDLDAGEKKYQQSLSLNPDDKMAKQELVYIKQLRTKSAP